MRGPEPPPTFARRSASSRAACARASASISRKRFNTWVDRHVRKSLLLLTAVTAALGAADLHEAVQSGNLEDVKALLAAGRNVNQPDSLGATPLHDAAWNGRHEIARYLLEQGANVNAPHLEGGSTPLAYAVMKNDVPMVQLLL